MRGLKTNQQNHTSGCLLKKRKYDMGRSCRRDPLTGGILWTVLLHRLFRLNVNNYWKCPPYRYSKRLIVLF